MARIRKDYAKRSENITRNKMIAQMWQDHPEKTMQQIADTFNVSYATVHNCVHKYIEFDNPIYKLLVTTNDSMLESSYSQATITRAFMAVRRWYPEVKTASDFGKLTFGSDIDNSPPMSAAVENLLYSARELARSSKHPHLEVI